MFNQLPLIIRDGIRSLINDLDGNKNSKKKAVLIYLLSPFIAAVFLSWNIDITNVINTFLSCISIFTALIFTVIFTVPDKLSQRLKLLQDNLDEASRNYLTRFSNFTKLFTQQVLFITLICILLIILLLVETVNGSIILQTINLFLFGIITLLLLKILSNIYILNNDELDIINSNNKNNNS